MKASHNKHSIVNDFQGAVDASINVKTDRSGYFFHATQSLVLWEVSPRLVCIEFTFQLKGTNTQHSGHMGQNFANGINGWNIFQESS